MEFLLTPADDLGVGLLTSICVIPIGSEEIDDVAEEEEAKVAKEEEEEVVVAAVTEEGIEIEEIEYKGIRYYKDNENFIYAVNEDDEPSENPVGYWKVKTQTIAFYKV
jgi:hypothetical protein